ncbi:MAG: hypothetical protein K8I27_10305 [Planctomycetes bacterium]|nr:hypothetical protein [Planctomycetota bacterium]
MKYSFLGIPALLFVLSACGGGAANNAAPAPDNTGGATQENKPPENKPDDTPREDPNAYRKVDGQIPQGWHSMAKPGRAELFSAGVFNEPGSDLPVVAGICTPKAPGPTEGDAEWEEWRGHVSAAILLYAGEPGQDVVKVMREKGAELIDGFDPTTVVKDGALGGGASADGRFVYMAFSNKLGTYVVVSAIAEGENHDRNGQAVIAWVESIKPN